MRYKVLTVLFLTITLISVTIYAQNPIDYLILQDIGSYIFKTQSKDFITGQPKTVPGYSTRGGSGILAGADHFSLDHTDTTYETDYINRTVRLAVEVQVTQHSGSDSDKWLLHEVEDGYRDGEMERLGLLTNGARLRDINGNKIISLRGSGYSWISNNVVVEISYSDLEGNKPEPLEVVQAYLQKFPSTIPTTLILDKAHDDQWIKDEMDRRLWLCDKWFEQLQFGKADQKTVLQEAVKSMNVFLDYREKYYGISAKDDKNLLVGYLQNNDEANIRAKLSEYKAWWEANKSGSLIGLLTSCPKRLWGYISSFFRKLIAFFSSLTGR